MSALKQAEAARHDIAMAEQMRGLGKLDDARRIAARVLASFPDHYAALHTLGLIEADRGNLDAALLALTKADAVLPGQPITMVALASVYLQMGSRAVAQRLIESAIAGGGGDSGACLTLGEIRREERDYEAALKAYDQALAQEPKWREARLCRAIVLTQLGRNAEAHDELAGILTDNPADFEAAAALAALPAGIIDHDISGFLARHPMPSDDRPLHERAKHMFFRANIADRLGEHDEAWRWLTRANGLMRGAYVNKIRENSEWQQDSLNALSGAGAKRARRERSCKTSLFILGTSRSGKTTAEAVLGRSPHVRCGYENPGFKNAVNETFQSHGFVPTFQLMLLPEKLEGAFRARYGAELNARAGDAHIFTNTSPVKIHDALRIWQTVPNAKFIFVLRDRLDLALRIYQTHYSSGNFYSYDFAAIMEHIEWYDRMIARLSERLGADCMIVRYEDLVRAPHDFIEKAERLLGMGLDLKPPGEIGSDVGAAAPYRQHIEALTQVPA